MPFIFATILLFVNFASLQTFVKIFLEKNKKNCYVVNLVPEGFFLLSSPEAKKPSLQSKRAKEKKKNIASLLVLTLRGSLIEKRENLRNQGTAWFTSYHKKFSREIFNIKKGKGK